MKSKKGARGTKICPRIGSQTVTVQHVILGGYGLFAINRGGLPSFVSAALDGDSDEV